MTDDTGSGKPSHSENTVHTWYGMSIRYIISTLERTGDGRERYQVQCIRHCSSQEPDLVNIRNVYRIDVNNIH